MVSPVIALVRLSRPRDWLHSKLPFVAAAGLLAGAPTSRILLVLATLVPWAAFGYGLNEMADRVWDERAERANGAAPLAGRLKTMYLLVTGGSTFALSLLWSNGLLVASGLALAAAYSARPLRLKERGLLGVAAGAVAQWVLPVVAVTSRPSVIVLSFLLGIRWMLVHQLHDAAADRRAGVHTFGAAAPNLRRIIVVVFSLEVVALFVALAATQSPAALVALVPSVLWPRERPLRERLTGYVDAPLAVYYFCLLPAFLAFERATPAAFALGALVLVLGAPPLRAPLRARFAPS
jgi:hypothetical protein